MNTYVLWYAHAFTCLSLCLDQSTPVPQTGQYSKLSLFGTGAFLGPFMKEKVEVGNKEVSLIAAF